MTEASPRAQTDRVPLSHAQTRATTRLVLAYVVAAAALAVFAAVRDWPDPRWPVLHLFLAGAVVLAISGVSLMLTVTWTNGPAPPGPAVLAQRLAIAIGAFGVVVGRRSGAPAAVVGTAGGLYLAGLVGLAVLLVVTARRGTVRRFDPAVASYVAAIAVGIGGTAAGTALASGATTVELRPVHLVANLLGLVGLVIGGTMPFFAATVGRSKMLPGATRSILFGILAWQVAALAVVVVSFASDRPDPAAGGLGAYALGVLAVLSRLPRPTKRQLTWAGPRTVALWLGGLWWTVAVAASAIDVTADRVAFGGRWLEVLVVAAYGQVLWGSLAYLLPMLRGGGHQLLGEGFATTRSWLGLTAVNVAGVALVVRAMPVAGVAIAVWVLDAAWRASRIGTTKAERPET